MVAEHNSVPARLYCYRVSFEREEQAALSDSISPENDELGVPQETARCKTYVLSW